MVRVLPAGSLSQPTIQAQLWCAKQTEGLSRALRDVGLGDVPWDIRSGRLRHRAL
jgi:hypothetical protein